MENKINSGNLYRGQKAAFTLAETMIVLVVLGVVAAITIPALVRNQMDAQNRTRLRKAMTVYDTAINKMVVENNFKSNTALTDWGNGNNCVNTRTYFKSAQDGANNCIFRVSDGIWWDITDITHPIIGLRESDLTDLNSSTRFGLVGHFAQDGSLRVNDVAYENAKGQEVDKNALAKLFAFVNNEKTSEYVPGETPVDIDWIGLNEYLEAMPECTTDEYISCCDYGNDCFDENGEYIGHRGLPYKKITDKIQIEYYATENTTDISIKTDDDDYFSLQDCNVKGQECNSCIGSKNEECDGYGFNNCRIDREFGKVCCRSGYNFNENRYVSGDDRFCLE